MCYGSGSCSSDAVLCMLDILQQEMDGRSRGLYIVSAFTWNDQSDIAMTL